mmetsp:Transcript_31045/g.69811  ORF Transcript_31045/g.69811 Transcript_31045/m.69811 type:complete len:384 (-) Transcript_31045:441-1592(-)
MDPGGKEPTTGVSRPSPSRTTSFAVATWVSPACFGTAGVVVSGDRARADAPGARAGPGDGPRGLGCRGIGPRATGSTEDCLDRGIAGDSARTGPAPRIAGKPSFCDVELRVLVAGPAFRLARPSLGRGRGPVDLSILASRNCASARGTRVGLAGGVDTMPDAPRRVTNALDIHPRIGWMISARWTTIPSRFTVTSLRVPSVTWLPSGIVHTVELSSFTVLRTTTSWLVTQSSGRACGAGPVAGSSPLTSTSSALGLAPCTCWAAASSSSTTWSRRRVGLTPPSSHATTTNSNSGIPFHVTLPAFPSATTRVPTGNSCEKDTGRETLSSFLSCVELGTNPEPKIVSSISSGFPSGFESLVVLGGGENPGVIAAGDPIGSPSGSC